ncbi:DUF4412 domain-containing protein [bacterium]|nr:DUF4412 domain-containing protein [candidate division CSSED10-310 bacterium]
MTYRFCLIGCLLLSLCISIVSADASFDTRTARPGMTEPSLSRTFMTKDAFRLEPDGNVVQIIHFVKRELIELNMKEKSYTVTRFDDIVPQTEAGGKTSQAENTINRMIASMEVTATDETQVINGYKCTKLRVVIMKGTPADYWVTKDVPEYGILLAPLEANREIFSHHNVLKSALEIYDVYKKLDGFTVKSISRLMNLELITESVNISVEPIDPRLFQPPEDFKNIETKK